MNEHLVPVKINADRRRDLAQKFQVTRWPTDVYLFPYGDEIYRGVSNADPAVYCKTIERIALRHRDWTVERNATARAKEKRQDRALAAHTPQIHTEQPIHAGNAGHSVRTQAASWTNQPDASQNVSVSPTPASFAIRRIVGLASVMYALTIRAYFSAVTPSKGEGFFALRSTTACRSDMDASLVDRGKVRNRC